ncbi:transcription elongation factor GreA [Sporosarcina sp. P3]|uniref:transcription elongation factor GreA n=1 Tax=Sporosarcina sp. P3 TaxID=2048245 RepID=UPI0026BC6DA4|nr:transcription elongation factor GreA [Sporosarcina sp. P3]
MGPKKYLMTQSGKEALLKELDELQSKKRQEALQRIKNARKFCDFREDSEYEAAVTAQAQIEERIVLILDRLRHAEVSSGSEDSTDTVVFGAPVTFIELPDGEEETYTIVGVEEADSLNGTISNESPLAESLLGRSIGDRVSVQTPSGEMTLLIVAVQ